MMKKKEIKNLIFTEYKIANILNTPIKYGNNNQFNSTNYNELFVNSMN